MGFYDAIRIGASGAVADYKVQRSLRFNDGDSPSLTRSPSGDGNKQTFTFSWWQKITQPDAYPITFSVGSTSLTTGFWEMRLGSLGLYLRFKDSSTVVLNSNAKFRDPSAWYHCVIAVDTTQATNSNRIKMYVNNEQITSFENTNYPSQNLSFRVNTTDQHQWGYGKSSSGGIDGPLDSYLAEINFIDGQALTPSSFGETNSDTGQWNPIDTSSLTFGTNGYNLKFADNSGTTATTLGKDSSGNSNNFTPNNFSVAAGVANDSLEDTPTNNFPTLNPIDTSSGTISNGNLDLTTATGSSTNYGNWAIPKTGKWYMESTMVDNGPHYSPIIVATNYLGLTDTTYTDSNLGYYINGQKKFNSAWSDYGDTFRIDDVIGVAVDVDNNQVTFYKNGSSQGTLSFTFASGVDYFFAATDGSSYGGSATSWNFGQRPFIHTVPTGFKKLCSANLPDPSIAFPNKHFNTLLYTGNGGSNSITGLEFQPDWLWIKNRGQTDNHQLHDAVRGPSKGLHSNLTIAEFTDVNAVTAFNSNGFSMNNNYDSHNKSSETYVAWNWKAGGSASSNSDGTITSSVSVNASAGFSIVTYTGNNASATVGHGLGVAPKVVMVKRRDGAGDWIIGHDGLASNAFANNKFLKFTSNSTFTNSLVWGSQPTSTVVQIVTGSGATNLNGSSDTYVMYCFSEVAGYSKFGSYTGNQNADGTFVFTGFRPALVITKGDWGSNWNMYDNSRNSFNVANKTLYPNLSNAESTENSSGNQMDLLSNGFKLRGSNNDTNHAADFIYLAFAESPFKYARAR